VVARIRQFRLKSHHHAQILSAVLFLVLFNFQSCARMKPAALAKAKAPPKIAEIMVSNPTDK
jgi:hypothetical protein